MMKFMVRLGLGLLILSFLLITGTFAFTLSHTIDGHASECEIAVGGTSFCLMSFEDMGALTDTFTQAHLVILFFSFLLAPSVLLSALYFLRPTKQRYRQKKPLGNRPIALYTLLFARGILHPKIP